MGNRAIAANGKGNWALITGAHSQLDAEEMALFGCDEKAGVDPYLTPRHMHSCALVDVNGKRLVQ